MTIIDRRRCALILEWATDQLSSRELCQLYPLTHSELAGLGLRMLCLGCLAQDALAVEYGLIVAQKNGISQRYLTTLLALADQPWHASHDDLITALDELAAPESVEVLYLLATRSN
jgi:hypothetical protein